MKDNFHQFSMKAAILMSTHNICFYGEISKMIPKLSSNTLHIFSTDRSRSPTLARRMVRVSKTAVFTLYTNLSPRILINGPVMFTTDGFRASALVKLISSPSATAACSLMSWDPFSIPSRNIGRTGVIPCARKNIRLRDFGFPNSEIKSPELDYLVCCLIL